MFTEHTLFPLSAFKERRCKGCQLCLFFYPGLMLLVIFYPFATCSFIFSGSRWSVPAHLMYVMFHNSSMLPLRFHIVPLLRALAQISVRQNPLCLHLLCSTGPCPLIGDMTCRLSLHCQPLCVQAAEHGVRLPQAMLVMSSDVICAALQFSSGQLFSFLRLSEAIKMIAAVAQPGCITPAGCLLTKLGGLQPQHSVESCDFDLSALLSGSGTPSLWPTVYAVDVTWENVKSILEVAVRMLQIWSFFFFSFRLPSPLGMVEAALFLAIIKMLKRVICTVCQTFWVLSVLQWCYYCFFFSSFLLYHTCLCGSKLICTFRFLVFFFFYKKPTRLVICIRRLAWCCSSHPET